MNARFFVAFMAVAVVGSASCGGMSRKQSSPSSAPGMEMDSSEAPEARDSESDENPQEEISRLAREISEWRTRAGLPAEPDSVMVQRMEGVDVRGIRSAAGPEPTSQTCREVCTISEKICDNATAICRLAETLGGDQWADEKCDSGKASCKEATERCTTCE